MFRGNFFLATLPTLSTSSRTMRTLFVFITWLEMARVSSTLYAYMNRSIYIICHLHVFYIYNSNNGVIQNRLFSTNEIMSHNLLTPSLQLLMRQSTMFLELKIKIYITLWEFYIFLCPLSYQTLSHKVEIVDSRHTPVSPDQPLKSFRIHEHEKADWLHFAM